MRINFTILILSILCSVLLFTLTNTRQYKHIESAANVTSTPINIDTINSEALQNISSVYNNKHLIVDEITTKKTNVLPIGSIIMWGKSADAIPDGWAVCDGKEGTGTPDLRDRFILASDSDFSGKGNGNINLGIINTSSVSAGAHSHKMTGCTWGTSGWGENNGRCRNDDITTPTNPPPHAHATTINELNLGTNVFKPRYHKLIFIMRIR